MQRALLSGIWRWPDLARSSSFRPCPIGSFNLRHFVCGLAVLVVVRMLVVEAIGQPSKSTSIGNNPRETSAETIGSHELSMAQVRDEISGLVRITISAEGVDSLSTAPRKDVRVQVQVGHEQFQEVALHIKGSKGSLRSIHEKPSLTLDFDQFYPAQRCRGLAKIHLNNSVEDPSYMKEWLGTELFATAGIAAPRVGHVAVEFNGRRLGLYVWKESFEDFAARRFGVPVGRVYEPAEVIQAEQAQTAQAGARADGDWPEELTQLQEVVDLDQFITFMAIEVMICHWDGYCLAQNNFRIYHDTAQGQLVFLPSGMDQLFGKADMPWLPEMSGHVARAVFELPGGRSRYADRFRFLLTSVLQPEPITRAVQHRLLHLRQLTSWWEFRAVRREAELLCSAVAARRRFLEDEINRPRMDYAQFEAGRATVANWRLDPAAQTSSPGSATGQPQAQLQIIARGKTSAAWRAQVRLPQGRYLFRGKVKVSAVVPLPFGKQQGASLRVAGRPAPAPGLVGTSDWRTLSTEFAVKGAEEVVTLLCELRAAGGSATFDPESLELVEKDR